MKQGTIRRKSPPSLQSEIRSLFVEVTPRRVRALLSGKPVRIVFAGCGLYLLAKEAQELIRVEPRSPVGKSPELAFALRDPEALVRLTRRLADPVSGVRRENNAKGGSRR